MRLESQPDMVARDLLANYASQIEVPPAPRPVPLQAVDVRTSVVS